MLSYVLKYISSFLCGEGLGHPCGTMDVDMDNCCIHLKQTYPILGTRVIWGDIFLF